MKQYCNYDDDDESSNSGISNESWCSGASSSGPISNCGSHNLDNKDSSSPSVLLVNVKAKYSPIFLQNVKSKLAQNKLRRDRKSDSLRSILSSTRSRTGDSVDAANKTTTTNRNSAIEDASRGEVKGGIQASGINGDRISKERNEPSHEGRKTLAAFAATTAATTARIQHRRTAAAVKRNERTDKCLQIGLEIMQSRSYDSTAASTAASSTFSISPISKEAPSIQSSIQYIGSVYSEGAKNIAQQPKDKSTSSQNGQPSADRNENDCNERDDKCDNNLPNEEENDTLSPLPPRPEVLGCASSSPMPSMANSCKSSNYAASSTATGTTASEGTNLFDMLRHSNTFNLGDGGEESSEEEEGGASSVQLDITPQHPTMTPSRPPLSPIPHGARLSVKQSKSQRGNCVMARGPKILMPSGLSPKIIRGSPSTSIFDNSSNNSDTTYDTPAQSSSCKELEYSFLANALVATNILATPPRDKSTEKKENDVNDEKATKIVKDTPNTTKRSHHELSYDSIGATSSPKQAPMLRPESLPRKRPRTLPVPAEQSNTKISYESAAENNGGGGSCAKKDTKPKVAKDNILSIASALDEEEEDCSSDATTEIKSNNPLSQEEQLAKLAARVELLEKSQVPRGGGSKPLEAYLDGTGNGLTVTSSEPTDVARALPVSNDTSALNGATMQENDKEETANLQERVKWLEKMLGFGQGGASSVFENDNHSLQSKLTTLERRLEEEMVLKDDAIQKALAMTTDLEAAQTVHENVEECLRQKVASLESELEEEKKNCDEKIRQEDELKRHIQSLESQLEDERKKTAERDTAAVEVQQASKATDDEMEVLRRTNEGLLKRQRTIEKELVSCARDNDALRNRLLSMASESSMKERTLSTALSQLKSLSESYYHIQQSLKQERTTRRDETSSLQLSLDDTSRHILKLNVRANELQAENDDLRNELRKLRSERVRSSMFRRAANGG